eukprot:TRINITY_DN2666_c0_g2_i1.p1 TRINITY_DN2666_c0_g2~~TRINITY_DN2666_c0_g2_i1.p1  ORF type:complete len:424 (-),score=64.74 TRINITY_DN2666_c0_g2_i1:510-1739(-)
MGSLRAVLAFALSSFAAAATGKSPSSPCRRVAAKLRGHGCNGSASPGGTSALKVKFDNPTSYAYSDDDSSGIPVDIHLPSKLSDKGNPLLVMLPGFHNEPSDVWQDFGFEDVMDYEKPWIVAVPPGRRDKSGLRFWAAWGDACGTCHNSHDMWYAQEDCNGDASADTDVDYIKAVVKAVQGAYPVDSKRIYLFGHSNGAHMTYRMACDVGSKLFAGMVVFAGKFPEADSLGYHAKYECKAESPVPFLHIHGAQDTHVRYSGCDYSAGSCSGGGWAYRGPVASIAKLAAAYGNTGGSGCSAAPSGSDSDARDGGRCGPGVTCKLGGNDFVPCDAYSMEPRGKATLTLIKGRYDKHDTEVYNISGAVPMSLWKINNAGHHPSGSSGLSGASSAWYYYEPAVKRWLLQHSRA